jgi:DNA-directed RNA polymerase sigma subunit (sigma70/sigma32)
MGTFMWPSEDGWPYPDGDAELVDPAASPDDDLLSLRTAARRMIGSLDAAERQVITARFGLDGRGARSFEQIQATTGLPPARALDVMGSGLAKLRRQLT